MRKLALFAMTAAAAAILPAAASAQTVVRHGGGMTTHGGRMTTHGGGMTTHGGGMTTHGRTSFHGNFRGGFHGGGFHGGMFPHRLHRGFIVPPMWFGPQFHVNNWQMYGFAPPPPRHRWVRYYDDAYLIDHEGRIRDERQGLDWDRYGERWDMEDGIPHYYGRGDWRPGPDDYAWAERHRGDGREDYDYAEYGADEGYGPPPGYESQGPGCQPGPQPCGGYGYGGYGYGYGYGVIAYPIVIETTVVSGGCGCCCTEEVVEEVVEVRERARPRYRPQPRPRPRRPAPPPPGERG